MDLAENFSAGLAALNAIVLVLDSLVGRGSRRIRDVTKGNQDRIDARCC
jgi:hypothetical protein